MGLGRARAAYVRSLPGPLGDLLRADQAFAVSVLFTAQFLPLRVDFIVVESAVLASLLAAPLHAITPDAIMAISRLAPRGRFTTLRVQAEATLLPWSST